MKLYHTTDAAETILANGFRDSSGSYGLTDAQERPFMLTGVFVSNEILDVNEGATGDDVLELTLPDDFDLDYWELIEEGKPYREWCVPAELLNRFPRRLLTDEEI